LKQEIFETTKEYVVFIMYLYNVKAFTVEQLSLRFNISKWLLYKRVKYWEKQGYVLITSMVGEKGGKQYQYKIAEKLEHHLEEILQLLKGEMDFEETKLENKK